MSPEEWSEELKRRHHYGKSLDSNAPPIIAMDLVTLDDIRDIQEDAIRSNWASKTPYHP